MDNYSTKHKIIASMALILMLAVGSALGYLVGSTRSDASSAEPLRGADMPTYQMGPRASGSPVASRPGRIGG